ncbi:PREDICTED: protein indeterminate-domain 6, chloroplastic-like isoform X2 [Camelina sativa]|uniref:Protein indeterminate-domain 6, chloroplastic-like isoform X2 n=1 Tax=Camelina sativa TaxID=90675 RepID=A0ABM0WUV9_CAMSA|nr:PREDICTED: protein indeterminate-domain 6, chloroplastic-like isoform X2 [Camelina sativa]
MSSSYNTSIASSAAQSFLISGARTGAGLGVGVGAGAGAGAGAGRGVGARVGANNFNRDHEPAMIQQPNSSVAPPPKKRRNQPGNPNPDAEVIALSPQTIMATNRFLCEVCNKGFQREQNLQLHRRGHNLPWKLKQKSNKEVRRKVYLCPEATCVHHDPARALGDLTGIKKHYYRKHGEKKFKCEKCSKRYAVQSDWKAHSKTCGTKEYRCDCGTIFSRRDSYITHRAFCDALIQESARNPTVSFTAMSAAGGGGGAGGRHGFYGGAASSLSHNHFGSSSTSGFTPLAAAGYNLNRSSPNKFEEFVPQSSNPNSGGPTNFLMQCAANQGLLAQNDQSLMNQHGLINLGDNINSNNNHLFNLGYFQDTKNPDQASVPSLFTSGADNNDPSALLRGLTSSSSSSVVVNDFGDTDNGNLQGLMNSLAATTDHQSRSGSIFDLHFGNNLSMGGSDRLTLDFLGVNGGIVSNVNGRGGGRGGGRNGAPLDTEMKFSHPNHPFGKA